MSALGEIVRNYQEQFGVLLVFGAYLLLSLLAAVVLFGVVRFMSTGRLSGTVPNTNLNIEFGGGAAGFLVTFGLLLWFHTSYVPGPTGGVEVSGNVFWKDGEAPIEGASVSIDGANVASSRTNADGLFRITAQRIMLEPKITVRARHGDATERLSDVDRDRARALRILLQRPAGGDLAYQKKYELLLAFAEDVTQFLNLAKWADEVARELEQLRSGGTARDEVHRKEAQFIQLRSDVDKLFGRIKKEFEAVRLTYRSKEVLAALQDFGAWWDATAKAEGRVDTSPDGPGQVRFQALLETMRREVGR